MGCPPHTQQAACRCLRSGEELETPAIGTAPAESYRSGTTMLNVREAALTALRQVRGCSSNHGPVPDQPLGSLRVCQVCGEDIDKLQRLLPAVAATAGFWPQTRGCAVGCARRSALTQGWQRVGSWAQLRGCGHCRLCCITICVERDRRGGGAADGATGSNLGFFAVVWRVSRRTPEGRSSRRGWEEGYRGRDGWQPRQPPAALL